MLSQEERDSLAEKVKANAQTNAQIAALALIVDSLEMLGGILIDGFALMPADETPGEGEDEH